MVLYHCGKLQDCSSSRCRVISIKQRFQAKIKENDLLERKVPRYSFTPYFSLLNFISFLEEGRTLEAVHNGHRASLHRPCHSPLLAILRPSAKNHGKFPP